MKDFSLIVKTCHELLSDDKYMNQQLTLIAVIAVIVWIGSMAVLAEQAELKGKKPHLVVLSGIFIPVIGPLSLYFLLPGNKNISEAAEDNQTATAVDVDSEAKPQAQTEKAVKQEFEGSYRKGLKVTAETVEIDRKEIEEKPSAEETKVEINQDYFQKLISQHGKSRNYVIFAGEQQYNVVELIEAMPALVVAMVRDNYEKEHRMRIPYSKITDVRY